MNNILQKATELANKGIHIYPINVNTKAPLTPHAFKDATTDLDTIKEWFSNADANTGMAIGLEKSGLVCIDVDNNHGNDGAAGTLDLGKLTKLHPDLLPKNADYIEATQNSGIHMFYKRPQQELHKIKLREHVELLVDSAIIAPTNGYKCLQGDFGAINTYLPSWITKPLNNNLKLPNRRVFYPHKRNIGRALDNLFIPTPEGTRHNELVTATCSLFATGADVETIQRLVFAIGENMGLEYNEVEQIFNWAVDQAIKGLKQGKEVSA